MGRFKFSQDVTYPCSIRKIISWWCRQVLAQPSHLSWPDRAHLQTEVGCVVSRKTKPPIRGNSQERGFLSEWATTQRLKRDPASSVDERAFSSMHDCFQRRVRGRRNLQLIVVVPREVGIQVQRKSTQSVAGWKRIGRIRPSGSVLNVGWILEASGTPRRSSVRCGWFAGFA